MIYPHVLMWSLTVYLNLNILIMEACAITPSHVSNWMNFTFNVYDKGDPRLSLTPQTMRHNTNIYYIIIHFLLSQFKKNSYDIASGFYSISSNSIKNSRRYSNNKSLNIERSSEHRKNWLESNFKSILDYCDRKMEILCFNDWCCSATRTKYPIFVRLICR